jgi:acetoin utilization deacetylase AcuC-like enzyme
MITRVMPARSLRGALERLRRILGRTRVPVWHHPSYRLPAAGLEGRHELEPRRADHAAWALRLAGVSEPRVPPRIGYHDLARVHSEAYLESLQDPATLARILAVDEHELVAGEVMTTMRLACGGTLAAAREALAGRGPALNLLGGFHHASPARGGGLCAVNDVAVAVAALRAEGFAGEVAVIDLDAHPPDGLADCFAGDARAWIGSLSGADWGPLAGSVDETVLPNGTGDAAYLAALAALLARMPRPRLAFVIAGGDVLAGDQLGNLGLTLDGARRRDARVAAALAGVASVWLPGGGYSRDAWKVLAGTGLVLAGLADAALPAGDPLGARFADIAGDLERQRLTGDDPLRLEDIVADLEGRHGEARLLDFYTAEGIEYGLSRYGILAHLERLGYGGLHVVVDRTGVGDRARLLARPDGGAEEILIETIVERVVRAGHPLLFVHWLEMRHPRAARSRELLPGQAVPGLGLAREMVELYERMAERLRLAGVAFRPSHYHLAYVGRERFRFLDAARQGRFEALVRDLAAVPLPEATKLGAEGRVRLGGEPYVWEADDMVDLTQTRPGDEAEVAAARAAAVFTIEPGRLR